MIDSLSYRIAAEGEIEFNKAVASAKKWIGANVNGPVKLGFSIVLKLSVPEGDSIQTVLATEPLFAEKNGNSTICNACKVRHHDRCTGGSCTCPNTKHDHLKPAVEGDQP